MLEIPYNNIYNGEYNEAVCGYGAADIFYPREREGPSLLKNLNCNCSYLEEKMKNRKLMKSVMNTVVCTSMAFTMFALSACNVDKPDDEPPAGQATQLDAPVITLSDNVISWSAVTNADAYDVYEGTTVVSSQTALSYIIDKHDGGEYTYTVKATSTGEDYSTSNASNAVTYKSITTYTVTFMMDDIVFDKQTVEKGGTAKQITTDPAKPGHIFDKWVTEKNGSTAYDFDTEINADTDVYASWTAKVYDSYKVTFETNGGSAVEEQDVTAGGKAEKPTAPTKGDDFVFAGWYIDEELTEEFDFNTAIDKATNLYAKWSLAAGVEAVSETTTWEFNAGNFEANNNEDNNYFVATADSLNLQNSTGTFHGLNIDATTGKLTSNGATWYQFNTSTKISFYVSSACTVKLTMYNNGLDYTVNGVPAKADDGFTYSFKGADKVTIESTANGYIGKIELTYPVALEPFTGNTQITFGNDGNQNYETYTASGKLVISGELRGNGNNSQVGTNTIKFGVNAGAEITVASYSGYTHYKIGMENGALSEEQTGTSYTFKATKSGNVVIIGTNNDNYYYSIDISYPDVDIPTIPSNCEEVTTTCDINSLAALYGTDKTSVNITYGKFEFEKGLKFESSKNAINTQGKTIYVTLTGINSLNSLSFDVANGASSNFTGVTVTNEAGTELASCGNESKSFTLTNLPAGKYTITSGGGSCRISNLKITEVLEQGSPVSMSVKPITVDFLKGAAFNSTGLTASVLYGNGATKSQTNLTVDSSSVDMSKEGEYIVRVFYTELGETVCATYPVYVYTVKSLTYSTYTTSSKTQVTLPTVYTVGGTFSVKGLTVNAVAKCGVKTKDFRMSANDYTYSTPDLTTVGEKTVTITAKANDAVTATFKVYVVDKAAVADNTVTVTVNPAKHVSSTNFNTIMQALTYLGNFDGAVQKIVNIADGEYFEKVYVDIPNVRLVGSATNTPDANTNNGVVICYDAIAGKTDAAGTAYGTDGSGTVSVTTKASNFVAQNITFKNYYNTNALYNESLGISGNSQAVALYVGSPSAAFYNCKITGYHDTLYSNVGNHYYKNCWIEGRTDFIFGSDANVYFDTCTIYTLSAGSQDGNGGYVCAIKPSKANTYSFVFNGCNFDGPETGATDIALGRAWGSDMKMVLMNSSISGNYSKAAHTNGTTKKQRYCTMSGNEPKAENMLEYNNTGAGAMSESIANTCTYMTETQADAYKLENMSVFGYVNAE